MNGRVQSQPVNIALLVLIVKLIRYICNYLELFIPSKIMDPVLLATTKADTSKSCLHKPFSLFRKRNRSHRKRLNEYIHCMWVYSEFFSNLKDLDSFENPTLLFINKPILLVNEN